jgi:hypothetical protein
MLLLGEETLSHQNLNPSELNLTSECRNHDLAVTQHAHVLRRDLANRALPTRTHPHTHTQQALSSMIVGITLSIADRAEACCLP